LEVQNLSSCLGSSFRARATAQQRRQYSTASSAVLQVNVPLFGTCESFGPWHSAKSKHSGNNHNTNHKWSKIMEKLMQKKTPIKTVTKHDMMGLVC